MNLDNISRAVDLYARADLLAGQGRWAEHADVTAHLDGWRVDHCRELLADHAALTAALADVATGRLTHRYGGDCPDSSQPDARDPLCHVCKLLRRWCDESPS